MIVVRNVFQLKFGKAKEALALWKEGKEISTRLSSGGAPPRLMTDLVGKFYTLVLENEFPSVGDMERESQRMMGQAEWKAWYQKFAALVESGYREIFTVVE
jgi:hypothetical protein